MKVISGTAASGPGKSEAVLKANIRDFTKTVLPPASSELPTAAQITSRRHPTANVDYRVEDTAAISAMRLAKTAARSI